MKTGEYHDWITRMNPLIGISIRDAQAIYDGARGGGSPLLQRVYEEIEAVNPDLMMCVDRRSSALTGLGWKIGVMPDQDDKLGDEQKQAIAEFVGGIGNLYETIEHLDQAFFRGFAHVQPIYEDDGTVKTIELLNSWNFLRAPSGEWVWNPSCQMTPEGLKGVADARLISISRPRSIDYPAMFIYIRSALGERDWGRFLERYAMPKPAVKMPQGTTAAQRKDFVDAAMKTENGQTSVWPYGTEITDFAGGARGQDPFSGFIEHQQKLTVLLATGGTLTSLAEAGSGTLAGNAHMDVWREIVARDAYIIGQAIDRMMVRPWLQSKFPGKPVLARFELGEDPEPDIGELFEIAAKARQAGYLIDQAELEEKSGFTLHREESGGAFGDPYGGGLATPLQNAQKPLQNARRGSSDNLPESGEDGSGAILGAFREDMEPATSAVKKLIDGGLAQADAKRLAGILRSMLPKASKTANVIEQGMAATIAATKGKDNA